MASFSANPFSALSGASEDLYADQTPLPESQMEETADDLENETAEDLEGEKPEDVEDETDVPTSEDILTELPMEYRLQESGNCYATETLPVTRHYRARDPPTRSSLQPVGNSAKALDQKAPCCIATKLHDLASDTAIRIVRGEGLKGKEGNQYRPSVSLNFYMVSQRPGLKLSMRIPDGREVVCHIFVNALEHLNERAFKSYGIRFLSGDSREIREVASRNCDVQIQEMAEYAELFMVSFRLLDINRDDSIAGPIFTGISTAELQKIIIAHQNCQELEPWQQLLVSLKFGGQDVHILRYWGSGNEEPAAAFTEWMECALEMTARSGNHWLYQFQEYFEAKYYEDETTSSIVLQQSKPHRCLAT